MLSEESARQWQCELVGFRNPNCTVTQREVPVEALGRAQPIMGTFDTLAFVASALFLMAGAAVLDDASARHKRLAAWVAPLLLAMHGRDHVASLGETGALRALADAALLIAPLLGAALLAMRAWGWLTASPPP